MCFFVFFKGCRAHLLSHSEKKYKSLNKFNMKLDDAIHVFYWQQEKSQKPSSLRSLRSCKLTPDRGLED